jgi:glycosyltransferase involved in cell wall biosynthesis
MVYGVQKKPMKVLLFANTDWYLYNFRLTLAQAIMAQGHDVICISPPGPYGASLEAAGCRWLPLPMDRRSLNLRSEARLLTHLITLYRRTLPDLAHHFTLKCVGYGALAARAADIPTVNAITGLGHVFTTDTLRTRLLRPAIRGLLRFCLNYPHSRLIVQNPDDREELCAQRLVCAERIRLIRGSGVDTQRFQPRAGPRRPGPFRVLLAARLIWEKGVGEYAEAARQLRQEGLPIEFRLAGDPDPGNPTAVSEGTIKEWQQQGLLAVLGHVEAMEPLLADTDLMVLPSYREGTPRSLLEAAACGLPIITTDSVGCREVVEHGVSGALVPPRDAAALAAAIRQLYHDPQECQRMGQAGRAKILAEFDERLVIQQTLAVYRELLG